MTELSKEDLERIERLRRLTRVVPTISITRARLVTESYKETKNEPSVIRRAKALEKVLSEMSIMIRDGELIVGDVSDEEARSAILPAEYYIEWLEREMDTIHKRAGDRFVLREKDKEILRKEIIPYWKGETVYALAVSLMPENMLREIEAGMYVAGNLKTGNAHCCVNYPKVLRKGLNGIKEEIEQKVSKLDPGKFVDFKKLILYKAMIIAINAVINFARRYSELARRMAQMESDGRRKAELEKIAEICERVPANPAKTFHEALQSIWFIQCGLLMEDYGWAFSLGRIDQYLYPYYKRDVENGIISESEALLLLALLFIKFNYMTMALETEHSRFFQGANMLNIVVIGGVDEEGFDATNELSYMVLDADVLVRCVDPEIVVRVSKKTPDAFLVKALEHAKLLAGKLKFVNDEVAIQKMLRMGYDIKDARNYVLVGCYEPFVPYKSHYIGATNVNLAKMFELALNDGKERLTGNQIGVQTGDPKNFARAIEDVVEAFRKQVEYFQRNIVHLENIISYALSSRAPLVFQSVLIDGCIEKGVEVSEGGALYSATWEMGVGVQNVGDSLAAIKKLVFEDKVVTMETVIDALDKNFEGYDELLNMISKVPKYGNDSDYVDLLMVRAGNIFIDEAQKYADARGGQTIAALGAVTCNIPFGLVTGALPDGRKASEPLAEGGISPHQGRNVSGPTATFKSAAKIDNINMKCGSVLNMRFNPEALKDVSSIKRLASMIRTYFDLGGYHVQFNIVSTEVLRDAQRHPEKYRDLLVRVATYSAYFVELSKELQDDIIARVEFGEV